MVKSLAANDCTFCGGWGHVATTCATKRTLDKSTRGFPLLRAVWGTIKGRAMKAGQEERAEETKNRLRYDALSGDEEEEEDEIDTKTTGKQTLSTPSGKTKALGKKRITSPSKGELFRKHQKANQRQKQSQSLRPTVEDKAGGDANMDGDGDDYAIGRKAS